MIRMKISSQFEGCAVTLRRRFQNGMVGARHGHGMSSVNQTRPRCINPIGKTRSKLLAARRGRGMGTACYVLINLKKSTATLAHPFGHRSTGKSTGYVV
jgi:hypothetical protein